MGLIGYYSHTRRMKIVMYVDADISNISGSSFSSVIFYYFYSGI